MASEDLFQNDYSEEPDLGQDFDKGEEMNIEAAEHGAEQVEQAIEQTNIPSSANVDPSASTTTEQAKTS